MREEFEKWAATGKFNLKPSISHGKYADLYVQFAWEAWQAATALQAERVRELEEALQAVIDANKFHTYNRNIAVGKAAETLSATAREVGE
jgi:hypothetical protein